MALELIFSEIETSRWIDPDAIAIGWEYLWTPSDGYQQQCPYSALTSAFPHPEA